MKKSEEYKKHLNNELIKAQNLLQTERNKCKHFETSTNTLTKEKNELIDALSAEKKKGIDLNNSHKMITHLKIRNN